jgi:hypothetical protein
MKKHLIIRIVAFLLGATLLAACAPAASPTPNSDAPAVNVPTAAPLATTVQNTPVVNPPTTAPLATATAKPASASAKDACALLTKDEVGKIFGQAVEAATGKGLGGVCEYTTKTLGFDLTVIHTGGVKYLKTTRASLAEMGLDVPGLGDEALYNTNSSTLLVRQGEATYLITYSDSSQQLTQEVKLAKEKAFAGQLFANLAVQ